MGAALGDVGGRQPGDDLPALLGEVDQVVDAGDEAEQVAMGQLHALRGAGGAGCVDQGQQIVETDPGGRRLVVEVRIGRDQVLVAPGAAVAVEDDQVLEIGQLPAGLLERLQEALLDDRHLGAGVADHVGDLLRRCRLIDRERDRAERHRAEVDREELEPVVEHQRDRVPLADAERREAARDRARPGAQLVPGQRPLAVDDRRAVAEPGDGLLEGRREAGRIRLGARASVRVPLSRRRFHPQSPSSRVLG